MLFPTFLGLRLVPMGLWFLTVGMLAPLPGRLSTSLYGALLALTAAAIWAIHR